jgi:hypothetical protein
MLSIDARIEAGYQLLHEVQRLAQHPGVRKNARFVQKRLKWMYKRGLEIVVPTGESNLMVGESIRRGIFKKLPGLKFYPFFLQDTALGQPFVYYEQRLAGYDKLNHWIIVNMQSCETMRFLAFSFLHELAHAHLAEDEGRAFTTGVRSDTERLQEELIMWDLDTQLVRALGGPPYLQVAVSWESYLSCL